EQTGPRGYPQLDIEALEVTLLATPTHAGPTIISPEPMRRRPASDRRRRVAVWVDPAACGGRVPMAKFLLPARPALGRRESKIPAKTLDLRPFGPTGTHRRIATG